MDYRERNEKIRTLIENYALNEATELIQAELKKNKNDTALLCFKGKILTKQQKYGDAMNTYHKVLELDPQHQKAATAIKMINGILKIRRTFYFENPYTDDNLYEQ